MKRLLILFSFIIFTSYLIAQEDDKSIEFEQIKDLDIPPIISGCNGKMDKNEIATCLQKRFSEILVKKLRFSVFESQNLPLGKYKVLSTFKISKSGKITDIKVDYENKNIANEIVRALESIRKIKPGIIDGKPVGVKYSFPIYFTLE